MGDARRALVIAVRLQTPQGQTQSPNKRREIDGYTPTISCPTAKRSRTDSGTPLPARTECLAATRQPAVETEQKRLQNNCQRECRQTKDGNSIGTHHRYLVQLQSEVEQIVKPRSEPEQRVWKLQDSKQLKRNKSDCKTTGRGNVAKQKTGNQSVHTNDRLSK